MREFPPLFDANVFLGPTFLRHDDTPDDVPRLLDVLDANGISRALVTHGLAKWQHPAVGNRLVIEETKGVDRLAPCWVVMPSIAGEMPPEREQVAQLLEFRRAGSASLHGNQPAYAGALGIGYTA